MKITDEMVKLAAKVLCEHGIDISLPWEGTLDDLEQERYNGLRAALEAATATPAQTARERAANVVANDRERDQTKSIG